MKNEARNLSACKVILLTMSLFVLGVEDGKAEPLGTGFTYQGQLNQGSGPASGTFDFEFRLYDGPNPNVATLIDTDRLCTVLVSNRLFTVELDFGAVFDGNARWLEIGVTSSGPCDASTVFTRLSPLQPITAVPYALFALSGNEGPQGPPGPQGPAGPQGLVGSPGINCWDINGNGAEDFPIEDINEDGTVDVLDCRGPKGEPGDGAGNSIAVRAIGTGLVNVSFNGERKNDYIDTEAFDLGDALEVAGGPKFTAPARGVYMVNYRQVFRNPTNEGIDIPTGWQYGIYLRVNGVNNLTYYSIISNIDYPSDYIPVEFTDIIQLNAGDTIEGMELLDPAGGGTLQKAAASFSAVLLHCQEQTGC